MYADLKFHAATGNDTRVFLPVKLQPGYEGKHLSLPRRQQAASAACSFHSSGAGSTECDFHLRRSWHGGMWCRVHKYTFVTIYLELFKLYWQLSTKLNKMWRHWKDLKASMDFGINIEYLWLPVLLLRIVLHWRATLKGSKTKIVRYKIGFIIEYPLEKWWVQRLKRFFKWHFKNRRFDSLNNISNDKSQSCIHIFNYFCNSVRVQYYLKN